MDPRQRMEQFLASAEGKQLLLAGGPARVFQEAVRRGVVTRAELISTGVDARILDTQTFGPDFSHPTRSSFVNAGKFLPNVFAAIAGGGGFRGSGGSGGGGSSSSTSGYEGPTPAEEVGAVANAGGGGGFSGGGGIPDWIKNLAKFAPAAIGAATIKPEKLADPSQQIEQIFAAFPQLKQLLDMQVQQAQSSRPLNDALKQMSLNLLPRSSQAAFPGVPDVRKGGY